MATVQDPAMAETGPRPVTSDGGIHLTQHQLVENAVAASEAETKLPRMELFRKYRPAAIYSALLSMALIMEGMDVGLINNFFAHPAYQKRFGNTIDAKGVKVVSTQWQTIIGAGNNVGSIIGLLLNGYLQSRFGSRRVYLGAMVLMTGTIFVLFFAQSVEMLLAGNILCGIPWGIFQTLTTAYAAEIAPTAMRGYLTAWVSMCWGAGSFLAAGVLKGTITIQGDAGWKIPYGLQWMWIPPLFAVAWFAPESPWYLIRRGKIEETEKSLRRLASPGHYTEQSMRETLALMKHTNEMEKLEAKNASYADCFRGANKRRTMIVSMAWIIQIFNGQSITNYAAQMLRNIGMSPTDAFSYTMGIQSVNIFATAIAIALMGSVGRRTFYLYGSSSIGLCMLIVGILGFAIKSAKDVAIPVAVFLIFVQIAFKISLGPTTYVIAGEMASSRVRAQTIVIGRSLYVCGQIVVQQLNPRMLNNDKTAWNWGAKTGLFYFGFCLIWVIWIFFFLPETKERSFAEIDYLFKKGVSARKFRTAQVDLFEFTPEEKISDDYDTKDAVERIDEIRA
ncbi:general substrate transporter [Boeremia exigua]|uniref:general substrate transporter n=1 Tax=Boeremia exigua TaxID=749465 RepID=UPI001E8CEC0A|nr:general substrate transporter [Boeremia exigua]KAH6638481.1 general substrate transporter [Boeremia exigua]